MHLGEISRHVARQAHGVVLMDRAGWHTTGKFKLPKNLTIILLPSRSPELNPVETIWQYMRANWLSNRVFEDREAILDAGCDAWNRLSTNPKPSSQSECGNGRTSVNLNCRLYNITAVCSFALSCNVNVGPEIRPRCWLNKQKMVLNVTKAAIGAGNDSVIPAR